MMNKPKELGATWDTLAHKVLASILVDHGAAFPVVDVLGHGLHWFPRKQAEVWRGVLQCLDENVPPSVEAVSTRCSADGYVQSIANQWTDEDNRNVVYNARELRRIGSLAEFRRVGREILKETDPANVTAAIEYVDNRLSGILSMASRREGDAAAVSTSAWAKIDQFQGQGVPTGLDWFDAATGGLWPGMNYWIVGNYKAGKTTVMRNLVLYALEQGHAVDVYCAEGSREMFTLDCQAMTATRLLCEDGEHNRRKLRLSGLVILRSWHDRDRAFIEIEVEAIQQARELWDGYNVRVWDTSDGIRNLATLKNRVRKSKFDHGSLLHWCDYSQLFGSGKTLFERQSATAKAVQEIATNEDVVVGMLSQRNEAGISGGSDAYSAHVKGGGDASAAADFMLMPRIDPDTKDSIEVKLKFSRHTGTGYGKHILDPASGLILDRWFTTREEQPEPDWGNGGENWWQK